LRQAPEQHLWGYRDQYKHEYFYQSAAHFVSEVGYHGCTDRRTLERFLDADHLWPWKDNDQWLTHATIPHPRETYRYGYRIPLMANQIRNMFGLEPDNLDDFILASQIFQAECKKFFIERMRCGKWQRTGVLWWNLRDGWPIISDAVVDYYGIKKLAYEYIRRVQQDVCVMVAPPAQGAPRLVAVNETREGQAGQVRIRDVDGGVLYDGGFSIAANGIVDLGALPLAMRPAMWLIEWTLADGTRAMNHYLAGGTPFDYPQYRKWLAALKIPTDVGPQRM